MLVDLGRHWRWGNPCQDCLGTRRRGADGRIARRCSGSAIIRAVFMLMAVSTVVVFVIMVSHPPTQV